MPRRFALTFVAVLLILANAAWAQSRFGPAMPTGSRAERPVPPPVGPIVPTPPPSAPPVGIAQLPSSGVTQTFTPAIGRSFSGRRDVIGRQTFGPRDVFRAGRFMYAPRYGNRFGYSDYGSI